MAACWREREMAQQLWEVWLLAAVNTELANGPARPLPATYPGESKTSVPLKIVRKRSQQHSSRQPK